MRAEPADAGVEDRISLLRTGVAAPRADPQFPGQRIPLHGRSPLDDNEQLEFLGDSVLGFLIAEALVRRFPEYREGELSRLKAHLVSAAHLHGVARRLDIGSYLELGRSEEMSGGRAKKTLLVDALEAVIAAVYLDGGLEPARRFRGELRTGRAVFGRRGSGHGHPAGDHELQERACRNWRNRASCRSRATPSCGSAGRSIPRPSRWKCGWGRNGPGRPKAAPRKWRRSGRRAGCTSASRRARPRMRRPV